MLCASTDGVAQELNRSVQVRAQTNINSFFFIINMPFGVFGPKAVLFMFLELRRVFLFLLRVLVEAPDEECSRSVNDEINDKSENETYEDLGGLHVERQEEANVGRKQNYCKLDRNAKSFIYCFYP